MKRRIVKWAWLELGCLWLRSERDWYDRAKKLRDMGAHEKASECEQAAQLAYRRSRQCGHRAASL